MAQQTTKRRNRAILRTPNLATIKENMPDVVSSASEKADTSITNYSLHSRNQVPTPAFFDQSLEMRFPDCSHTFFVIMREIQAQQL